MTKYLLLRDNKQSGPFDLDELRAKGLKAYDLVWIDGKSAAWRYPSEVEELKPFAPIVEEQPFDRFYKKASQENSSVTLQAKPVAESKAVPEKATLFPSSVVVTGANTVVAAESSSVPGKRIIYVTLPASRTAASTRETVQKEPARTQPTYQELASSSLLMRESAPQPNELSSLYVAPAVVPAEEKFSQAQDGMWRSAVEIAPRKKRDLSRGLQLLGVIVCVLALLAAGIFIGLSINRNSLGSSQKFAAADQQVVNKARQTENSTPIRQGSLPLQAPPAETHSVVPGADTVYAKTVHHPAVTEDQTASTTPNQKKKTSAVKEKPPVNAQKSLLPPPVRDSLALSYPALHRESSHRTDAVIDKDAIKSNISNLVSVGSNKYNVGTFGGISELQLTVSNRSIYPLDLVVVEVQYVQANKKVYKTETLQFSNVGAGGALMLEAPKSSRGIKVQYKIRSINSKELGLSYSAI